MQKKTGMIFSLELIMVLSVMVVTFSSGFYLGGKVINNFRSEQLKNECMAIDRALEMYSKAHRSVLSDTVRADVTGNKLVYESGRVYPENLSDLGVIQSEFGYFTTKINLTKFSYQTTETNGAMTYELGVTLPNGAYYKSPRSNK